MVRIRSEGIDTVYLLNDQYKDSSNLAARARLHYLFSTNKYGWQRWLFDQFEFPPRARVIEFGAGPGDMWIETLARVPADWDITLSDFSIGMVEECKRNLAESKRRFKHEVIDVQFVPYGDETFDAVIANCMLYHVPNLKKALSEMRRILKPTGKLYTATFGKNHMHEIHDLRVRFDATAYKGFKIIGSFELDSGAQSLSEFFPNVAGYRYEDSLMVTESEPLIDYILSGRSKTVIVGEKLTALRTFIQQEIAANGAIHITKESGMLISSIN